jgi:hypothetical protein
MVDKLASDIFEGIKKWGFFIFLCVIIWMGLKKVFDWGIVPLLLWCFLKTLSFIFSWTFVDKIDIYYLIGGWVFLAVICKRVFFFLFEKG